MPIFDSQIFIDRLSLISPCIFLIHRYGSSSPADEKRGGTRGCHGGTVSTLLQRYHEPVRGYWSKEFGVVKYTIKIPIRPVNASLPNCRLRIPSPTCTFMEDELKKWKRKGRKKKKTERGRNQTVKKKLVLFCFIFCVHDDVHVLHIN